jgi:hypothetical protein
MQPFIASVWYNFKSMQEEFVIFVKDLFSRIGDSSVALFKGVTMHIASVPFEFIFVACIASIILLFRVPLLRSIVLIPYLIVRPFLRMFGLITNTEPWSVVYDSKSKYPLDPVYVSIHDMVGVEVASAVTDLEGRFGVVLPRGTYTISVQKTNYSFPSKRLAGKKNDGYHNQLYFGERFTIVDEERVLAFHIPMDPEGEDWNQKEKKRMKLFGVFRKKYVYWEGVVFFAVIGAILALSHYVVTPSEKTKLIVFAVGVLLFALYCFVLLRGGELYHSVVLDKQTKNPIPFARVKIFTKEKDFQVGKRITTLYGQFVCLLSPGTYYVTIEKRNLDGTYELVCTSSPFTVKDGYIHKKFIV